MSGKRVRYGLTISEEYLGDNAPVLLQGGLEKSIIRASELGFDSVEMHIRGPSGFDVQRLKETAGRCGVEISAIGTGLEYTMNNLCFTSPDKGIRNKMSERMMEHIDLAGKLGSVVFLGLCRGRAPDFASRGEYLERLAEELAPIVSYAREKEVTLAFEPIAYYMTNLLNTTEETLEFLNRPGLQAIQLLLDTHHMFLEDKDMEKAFRICRGRIAHVHISDSNRKYPGSGNIDFVLVGNILKEIGYDRAISLELLPYPEGEGAAAAGLEVMRRIM